MDLFNIKWNKPARNGYKRNQQFSQRKEKHKPATINFSLLLKLFRKASHLIWVKRKNNKQNSQNQSPLFAQKTLDQLSKHGIYKMEWFFLAVKIANCYMREPETRQDLQTLVLLAGSSPACRSLSTEGEQQKRRVKNHRKEQVVPCRFPEGSSHLSWDGRSCEDTNTVGAFPAAQG